MFLVNVPVGLAAIVIGWQRLPRVSGQPVPRPDPLAAALVTVGVSALTLGLVKGGDWGWSSAATLGALAGAVLALGAFALHCARHRNPLIDARLFRVRTFTGASAVSLVFSIAFGAMLFSRVLLSEEVWHWSALRTGLSIAPGPIMVPIFAFLVARPLIARFGPGRLIAAGATIFTVGAGWWALSAGLRPDYVNDMLGGIILTGIGVGLTLPTFMATGAAALPANAFATGSAVLNMLRQVGLAFGVAVFIAVIGSPHTGAATLSAYRHGWEMIALASLLSAICGAVLLRRRPAAVAPDPGPGPGLASGAVAIPEVVAAEVAPAAR